jgi:acyl carrier protein
MTHFTEDSFLKFLHDELDAIPEDFNSLDAEFRQFKLWSSLNALFLISRLADETGVFLSSSELAACKTFRDIFQLIQPQ